MYQSQFDVLKDAVTHSEQEQLIRCDIGPGSVEIPLACYLCKKSAARKPKLFSKNKYYHCE
jgi:hypothetical protein